MFDNNAYNELIDKLKNFGDMGEGKRYKFIRKVLEDEEFLEWVYNPRPGTAITTPNTIADLFALFTKQKVMNTMNAVIEDRGYQKFGRMQVFFMSALTNVASGSATNRAQELRKLKQEGSISGKDAKSLEEKILSYNETIQEMYRVMRKISKHDAKELAKLTNLTKDICMDAYWSVPDCEHLNKYRIGTYLNSVTDLLYARSADNMIPEPSNIRWKQFFKGLFGKDNVDEVATWILLEGVRRIDRYEDNPAQFKRVRECWDVLTNWALRELNDAPDDTRNHMLDLYIKRVDKQLQNRNYDLRVNLLNLDNMFPNLLKTIEHYSDKIVDVLTRNNRTDNIPNRKRNDDD